MVHTSPYYPRRSRSGFAIVKARYPWHYWAEFAGSKARSDGGPTVHYITGIFKSNSPAVRSAAISLFLVVGGSTGVGLLSFRLIPLLSGVLFYPIHPMHHSPVCRVRDKSPCNLIGIDKCSSIVCELFIFSGCHLSQNSVILGATVWRRLQRIVDPLARLVYPCLDN
jgi:hypothetical protein